MTLPSTSSATVLLSFRSPDLSGRSMTFGISFALNPGLIGNGLKVRANKIDLNKIKGLRNV